MATPHRGSDEFVRVFGAPAHTAPAETEGTFEGWCDDWPDHAVYKEEAAEVTLCVAVSAPTNRSRDPLTRVRATPLRSR